LTFSSKIGLYDVQGPIPIVKNVFIPPDSDGALQVDLEDIMPLCSFLAPVCKLSCQLQFSPYVFASGLWSQNIHLACVYANVKLHLYRLIAAKTALLKHLKQLNQCLPGK
jgi:hypothetical protein